MATSFDTARNNAPQYPNAHLLLATLLDALSTRVEGALAASLGRHLLASLLLCGVAIVVSA